MLNVPADSTWGVVQNLGLEVTLREEVKTKTVVYGSADPLPNPGEFLLTELIATRFLQMTWQFFVYCHGKNLPMAVPPAYVKPRRVFSLEEIIPQGMSLKEMAAEIFRLRQEPVVVAHLKDKVIRATTKIKDVPCLTIGELHQEDGWLGGSSIHFLLRLYAEEKGDVVYLCPFSSKGRVYLIYQGVKRPLFIFTPFVRIQPPPQMAPGGWEPLPWLYWLSLPAIAHQRARKLIEKSIERFLQCGDREPRRIEVPWGWWLL